MALLSRPWQLHDVADVEALIQRAIGASGFAAELRPHERDDCAAFLLEVAWESAEQFDPNVGRVAFSTFLFRRARQRAVDWYRKERGRTVWRFSGGRIHERRRPEFLSLDGLDDAGLDRVEFAFGGSGVDDGASRLSAELRTLETRGRRPGRPDDCLGEFEA